MRVISYHLKKFYQLLPILKLVKTGLNRAGHVGSHWIKATKMGSLLEPPARNTAQKRHLDFSPVKPRTDF